MIQISKLWTAPELNPINNKAKWVPILVFYSAYQCLSMIESHVHARKSVFPLLAFVYGRLSFLVRISASHAENAQNGPSSDHKRHCQR